VISIQKIRNPYFMRGFLWAIILITIPSFVLFYGFAPSDQSMAAAGPLVTVQGRDGKVELTGRDLERAQSNAARHYTSFLAGLVDPNRLAGIQSQIEGGIRPRETADFAVSEIALDERRQQAGLRVTEAQVSESLRAQKLTREQLNTYLRSSGLSEYEFAANQRVVLQGQLAEFTVTRIARTSLLELWDEYLQAEEKVEAELVSITVPFIGTEEIPESDIETRYGDLLEKRDTQVIEGAKRVYEHVFLGEPPAMPAEPTDDELRAAYDQILDTDPEIVEPAGIQVRHILIGAAATADPAAKDAAKARAEGIRTRVLAGENFGDLANQFTEDTRNMTFPQGIAEDSTTSPTLLGGTLPDLLSGEEVGAWGQPYIQFVRESKIGETSEVIDTPQGFVVSQVIERREAKRKSFDEVRETLTTRLAAVMTKRANDARTERLAAKEKTLREAVASQTTIEGIARAAGAEVVTTSPTLVSSSSIPGIGGLNRERTALTSLKAGLLSNVLQADAGGVAVIRIKEEIAEREKELSEVTSTIRSAIQREREVEKALARGEELKARVVAGENFTSATLAMKLEFAKPPLEPFTRAELPTQFRNAIDFGPMLASAKAGDVLVFKTGFGTFIQTVGILHVKNVASPSIEKFLAEDVGNYESLMLSRKQRSFVEEYRRSAKDTLKATYSDLLSEEEKPRKAGPSGS